MGGIYYDNSPYILHKLENLCEFHFFCVSFIVVFVLDIWPCMAL